MLKVIDVDTGAQGCMWLGLARRPIMEAVAAVAVLIAQATSLLF